MEPGKDELSRRADATGTAKTVLIVGAGAVQNGWEPVLRAVAEPHTGPLSIEATNSKLANLVYLCRMYHAHVGPQYAVDRMRIWELFSATRGVICDELRRAEAAAEIRVRPEFPEIMDKLVIQPSSSIYVINTNWDTVVDTALNVLLSRHSKIVLQTLHVHGVVNNPECIYMPTETVHESYRSRPEIDVLRSNHGQMIKELEECDRVVLYGVSLSPLDAELCGILWAGLGPSDPPSTPDRLREVLVISLETDLSLIAERVNYFLQRSGVTVKGCAPSTLSELRDFTVANPED